MRLIQLGEEYERLFENVRCQSDFRVTEKAIFTAPHIWSMNKVTVILACLKYVMSKGIALRETCGIIPEVEEQKGQPLSLSVLQTY